MTDPWEASGSVHPVDLIDASLELHWATQFLAAAGQTFGEAQPDDSHRAMEWDADQRAFVGTPFTGPYPFRVGLRPEDLTLLLLDRTEEALGSFPLIGKTREEGYEWLSLGLAMYMGGLPATIERPEFDIPDHPVQGRTRFSTDHDAEHRALAGLYGGGAALLNEFVAGHDNASRVLCWPHHFDIATLITLDVDADGAASKTIGVGLAPRGGGCESWYWYVTPWPYPDPSTLPDLTGKAEWNTEGWTGAVLAGRDMAKLDGKSRAQTIRAFLAEATEVAQTVLGR